MPSSIAWKGPAWVQSYISSTWTPEFAIGAQQMTAKWPWPPIVWQAPVGISEGISSQWNVRFWFLFSLSPLLACCYFLLALTGIRKEPSRNVVYLDVNVGSPWVLGAGSLLLGSVGGPHPPTNLLRGEERKKRVAFQKRKHSSQAEPRSLPTQDWLVNLSGRLPTRSPLSAAAAKSRPLGDVITAIHCAYGRSTAESLVRIFCVIKRTSPTAPKREVISPRGRMAFL